MKPDAPLDPELQTTRLTFEGETHEVHHTDTGSGVPVIALHGVPASSRDFRWLDAAIDSRLRMLRVDLPGFGASAPRRPNAPSYSGLATVVVELCDALGLEDAIVLGHSLGGAVALEAAARSDRIERLVLVNSSGPIQHRGNFPRLYRAMNALGDLHPLARRAVLGLGRPLARQVGFSKRIGDAELVYAARLGAAYEPARFGELLRELGKPTLSFWATRDPAIQPAVAESIIACGPHVEGVRIDAKSHNLQATHAIEVAEALVGWATA